jgi:hypothetical protein
LSLRTVQAIVVPNSIGCVTFFFPGDIRWHAPVKSTDAREQAQSD